MHKVLDLHLHVGCEKEKEEMGGDDCESLHCAESGSARLEPGWAGLR